LLPSLTSFLPVPRPCRGTWWTPSACSSASGSAWRWYMAREWWDLYFRGL